MIRRLVIIWVSVLCASIVCAWLIIIIRDGAHSIRARNEAEWATGIILVLSVGAATMLMNCSKRFRSNGLLRFLSFFLLPMAYMVVGNSGKDGWAELPMLSSVFIPFWVFLTAA